MKYLRIHHYAYLLLTIVLVLFSGYKLIGSFRVAQAEETPVTITSPTPNQQVAQGEQSITGTGPALKKIIVFDGEERIGTTIAQADGVWSLDWDNQVPGDHTLKAIAETGSVYRATATGSNSIQTHDVNNGQITQNYASGFSGSINTEYDSGMNKLFVINYIGRTISLVNAETKEVVDTVTYSSTSTAQVGNFSSIANDSVYDEAHHKLYILETDTEGPPLVSKIHIFDTQTLTSSTTILDDSDFGTIGRRLLLDPSANFLYLYSAQDDDVGRINLSTNTPDASWNNRFKAKSIVATPNGDVYFNNGEQDPASLTQVYTEATDSLEALNIDESVCTKNSIASQADLALSSDYKTVYFACQNDNEQVGKILAYSTETASVDTTFSYDRILTNGKLTGGYLLLYTEGDSDIRVINSTSNTEEPIVSGFSGAIEENSFLFSDSSTMHFLSYEVPNNHLYTVDLETGTITNTQDYSVFTSFYGVQKITKTTGGTPQLVIAPEQYTSSLSFINISTGELSNVYDGMGLAWKTFHSAEAERVFTIDLRLSNDLGAPVVKVANTTNGEYQGVIDLPNGFLPGSGVMSGDGATLYVAGTFATFTGDATAKIYAINTSTLSVDRVYSSVENEGLDYSGINLALNDDALFFMTSTKLYRLNLETDTTQTVNVTACVAYSCSLQGIASDNGQYIASVTGLGSITIYNAADLSVVRTINHLKIFTSISFDTEGNLLVGMGTQNTSSPKIEKYSVSTGERISSINLTAHATSIPTQMCMIKDITRSNQSDYRAVTTLCMNMSTYGFRESLSLIDIDRGLEITNETIEEVADVSSYGILDHPWSRFSLNNSTTDIQVSSATQQVTVVGSSSEVDIIEPAQNTRIEKGRRTISGSAGPNSIVVIKVDGQSIGSVQADSFGAWEKNHTFSSTGSHIVKAEQQQEERQILYLNKIGSTDITTPSSITTQSVYAVDASTQEVLATITLPEDYKVGKQQLSADKEKLYILGFNASSTKIFEVDTSSNEITSNVTLEDYVVSDYEVDEPNNQPVFGLSPNQQKVYTIKNTSQTTFYDLVEYDLDTGEELQAIELPESANKPLLLPEAALYSQSADLMLLVGGDSTTTIMINLDAGTATANVLPEGMVPVSIKFDSNSGTIYGLIRDNSTNETRITGSNLIGGEVTFSVALENVSPQAVASMLLSDDGNTLYIPIVIGSQPGLAVVNTTTGEVEYKVANAPENSEAEGFLYVWGLAANADYTEFYITHINDITQNSPTLAVDIFNLSTPAFSEREFAKAAFASGSESITAFGSNFSMLTEGGLLNDQHTITVFQNTDNPDNPDDPDNPDNPDAPELPEIPGIIKPPKSTDKPNKQSPAGVTALKEVEKKITNAGIFSGIRQNLGKLLRRIPLPVVSALPYFLFLILLLIAAYYLYQSQKQLRREQRLRALFEKQRVLSEEKRNFLELTSHYLRTPLTYIKAGSEMITKAQPNQTASADLAQSVNHLGLFVESLVEEATSKQQKIEIEPPDKTPSPWLSKSFLLPLSGFITALVVFYLSFIFIAGVKISSTTLITQVLICFLVAQLSYGLYKNYQRINEEEESLTKTLKAEEALDDSRSKLLKDAGEQLETRTQHLAGTLKAFPQDISTSQNIIKQGIERLQELARTFGLVSLLETKSIGGKMEPIFARDLAAKVIEGFSDVIRQKNLKVSVEGFEAGVQLTTNRPFAELTLKSLVENAINASKEGASITLKCIHSGERVAFQVIDHGEGIPKEKLSQLFKPFVRVGPVTTFNREGIGLSLFIDRLIMHSLGGEVEIKSIFKQGTTATLVFAKQ